MGNVIYDIGAFDGRNLSYFLLKADTVVAVEANPFLCESIARVYRRDISAGRLIVINCVATPDQAAGARDFYLHKANATLGTSVTPPADRLKEYDCITLPALPIADIVARHGNAYYMKIDAEGADASLLRALFSAAIFPEYLSAEAHTVDVFALLVAEKSYQSFKVVEGDSVGGKYGNRYIKNELTGERVRHVFSPHSSGPFGNEIDGPWLDASALMQMLAIEGFGWKDIHASAVDRPASAAESRESTDSSRPLDLPVVADLGFINVDDSSSYPRVAVITPYCEETLEKLMRCHKSVADQSFPCTHFLISDGPRRPEIAAWPVRHIELGECHRDNGNTPRGIGAICAMNEGYEVILFLDADNWYAADHVASVLYTQAATGSDIVFSDRFIVFPSGELVKSEDPEDASRLHVDTSCIAIFSPAFRALSHWCLMPRELGPWCDRVMFSLLTSEFSYAWTEYKSVYFETWYVGHFMLAGKGIPSDAKWLSSRALSDMREMVNAKYAQRSYRICEIVSPGDDGVGEVDPKLESS